MTNLKRAQLLRRRVDRLGRGLSIWIVATLGLSLAILVAAISSPAQAPGKVPHIGYLWIGAEGSDRATSLPGFQQGLRELGYEEGVNVAIAYRYAGGSMERLRELISDMIDSKGCNRGSRGDCRRCGKTGDQDDPGSRNSQRSGRLRLGP
jgi:hypothetical protein